MTLRRPHCARRSGVTLLEVILAMSLLVILTSMTYSFYFSSISTRQRGTREARKLRLARIVLDRMAGEIRQAVTNTGDYGLGFNGGREELLLTTVRVPRREIAQRRTARMGPKPNEYDLVKLQYKIARHPDLLHDDGYEQSLGLARLEALLPRRETPIAESDGAGSQGGASEVGLGGPLNEALLDELFADQQPEEGDASIGPDINWEELYAPGIHYLRFCYYDGYSWWDEWHVTGENPLPQLVQVTIGFDEHAPAGNDLGLDEANEQFCSCLNAEPVDCEALPKGEYSTVVRLARADPLFRSRVSREGRALAQKLAPEETP